MVNRKLLLLLSLLLLSCIQIKPTYKRENIEKEIKRICKEEFNIENVVLKETGDTIWVYVPFESILDEDLNLKEEIIEKMRYVSLSISRVLLSTDRPPKFYVMAISDVYQLGADLIEIVYFEDLKKFFLWYISNEELSERSVIKNYLNVFALGDYEGKHLNMHDISFEEFLCELLTNKLNLYFFNKKMSKFKSVKCDFDGDFFKIRITAEEGSYLKSSNIDDILRIIRFFTKIYEYKNFLGVEIFFNGEEIRFISYRALEKIPSPLRLKPLLGG